MGSTIEINDTLQITSDQGFPQELDLERHKTKLFTAEDFDGKTFQFKDKSGIRMYQQPPVRNFLAHNIDGTWLYWGLVHVIEVVHDTVNQTTSGKFTMQYIYTPKEMKQAHALIDRNKNTDFLGLA